MCVLGIVLSVAPLMGADPVIDPSHKRWLHVHVRPPVRGLLKVPSSARILSCVTTLLNTSTLAHLMIGGPNAGRIVSDVSSGRSMHALNSSMPSRYCEPAQLRAHTATWAGSWWTGTGCCRFQMLRRQTPLATWSTSIRWGMQMYSSVHIEQCHLDLKDCLSIQQR
jgi:hypothetical protein